MNPRIKYQFAMRELKKRKMILKRKKRSVKHSTIDGDDVGCRKNLEVFTSRL